MSPGELVFGSLGRGNRCEDVFGVVADVGRYAYDVYSEPPVPTDRVSMQQAVLAASL